MKYEIIYSDAFVASLKKLQGKLATKIVKKLELLANDPYAPNNNVKRMIACGGLARGL